MIISLKVSPLSKKILRHDHPTSPIRVTRRNILFPLLHSDDKKKENSFLSETIILDVPKPPSSYRNAGENIHRYHLSQLETYVFAQFRIGAEGKSAISNFFEHYGLDDDDYDIDSAYRRWQRYLHEKKTLYAGNSANNLQSSVIPDSPKIPLSELEQIVAEFTLRNFKNFLGYRNKVRTKVFHQLRVWTYSHIGGYEISEIADILQLSLNNTYKYRSRFSDLVRLKKLFPFPELPQPSYN